MMSKVFDKSCIFLVGQTNIVLSKLPFKLRLTLGDILVPALILKPRTNFIPCRACLCNRKPIPRRSFILLGRGENFHNLARLNHIVKRNNSSVNLCAYHSVADSGMNCIRKVDNGRAYGYVDNVALRSKHKSLLGYKV